MTLLGAARVLLVGCAMVPGMLLSAVLAWLVFATVPDAYTSSGVAVLVPAKWAGGPVANPLLNFDASLNTNAMILIQALNDPQLVDAVATQPGDSYTVANSGETTADDLGERPFLYITTKSWDPARSTAMVSVLLDTAAQQLSERQREMRVLPIRSIQLDTIVDPTPPKRVVVTKTVAAGGAFLLGLVATVALTLWRYAFRGPTSALVPAGWPASGGLPAPAPAPPAPALPPPHHPSSLPVTERAGSPGAVMQVAALRRIAGSGGDQVP